MKWGTVESVKQLSGAGLWLDRKGREFSHAKPRTISLLVVLVSLGAAGNVQPPLANLRAESLPRDPEHASGLHLIACRMAEGQAQEQPVQELMGLR